MRDSVCHTHQLGLAALHHCHLLLSTTDGWRNCKGKVFNFYYHFNSKIKKKIRLEIVGLTVAN